MLKELKEKDRQQHISPMILAQAHLGLGEIDKAFEFLEKAYQERWPQLVTNSYENPISPIYDNLGSDPRHKALLEKINLQ